MRLVLAAALLAALPARADTWPDVERIDACLAANPGDGGVCIGRVFDDCVAAEGTAPGAGSYWKEIDIECGARATAAWDAVLNRDYAALREVLEGFGSAADALRDAQRKWIAFRDADCNWPLTFLPGNDAHHQDVQCPLQTTAERAVELHHWLELLQ